MGVSYFVGDRENKSQMRDSGMTRLRVVLAASPVVAEGGRGCQGKKQPRSS